MRSGEPRRYRVPGQPLLSWGVHSVMVEAGGVRACVVSWVI